MKTTILRMLLVLLAALLCLSLLACADTPDDPSSGNTDNPSTGDQTGPSGDDGAGDTTPQVMHSVPEGTYFEGEDAVVNVLHYTVDTQEEIYIPWDEIAPSTGMEVSPGDTVGNLVFARNAWIEGNYGITITNEYEGHSDMLNLIERLYQSGDDQYQLIATFQHTGSKMMGRDYFLNLGEIKYLDYDDPWWVDSAIEELSLAGYVEFGVTDLLLLDKGATALMYYNQDLAEDIGIEGLYELARDGDWTMEKMIEFAALALDNADGDDEWGAGDVYGLVTGDDPVLFLYCGAGYKFIEKDDNGDYYYSYCSDDGTAEAMISILEDVMYADWCWNHVRLGKSENPTFKNGQSLFDFNVAKGALSMREMESNFGVLPIPKMYDEQEQYYSQVSGYHDSMFAIPIANQNTDAIGAAIELMSYYSYYNIQETFYETILQLRGTRDEESMEMLDIVFASRTYDLGHLYDPEGVIDKVLRYNSMTHPGETGVISFWAQFESQLETALEDLHALRDRYADK